MTCIACTKSPAWHRRMIEQLERTIGPEAGQRFESAHPELSDDDRAEEHEQGEHASDLDLDCPTCQSEADVLGMGHLMVSR